MENPTMTSINNNNQNNNPTRTGGGKGRRKVEMKKIEDKTSLIVTFSKRKGGLFRKAKNATEVCGAKTAVITFSPMGKPYAVGYPSVDSVVDQYLRRREGGVRDEEEEEEEEGFWWEKPIEGMNKEELKEFKDALVILRSNLEARLEDLRVRNEQTRDFLGVFEHGCN